MRVSTRVSFAVVFTIVAAALSGCGPTGDDAQVVTPTVEPVYPQVQTYPEIPVIENIPFSTTDGTTQRLDACFPADAAIDDPTSDPRAVIVSLHGGSWQHGDKSNLTWRSICQWFASEGFVAVSVNYRLAPEFTFPAQLDDVQDAVRWLRDPAQVTRYNIDPARIGAFGGSAGGNLAALLGVTGSGSWATGARVAAVAELSGPADLRDPIPTTDSYSQDFAAVQLQYTGCATFTDCDAAAAASPVTQVDDSDPPFFVAHSSEEFIPISQAQDFVRALRDARVAVTFVTVKGTLHSVAMLDDDMRARVLTFFRDNLGS